MRATVLHLFLRHVIKLKHWLTSVAALTHIFSKEAADGWQ